MDFKFCLLSAGHHLLACHACPKVTVSRLIVCDDGGSENCGKMLVTQSSAKSHNFQANNSDDGDDRDCTKTPVTQSSQFGFLNLNYSEITLYFKMPFWLLVDNKYIYIMPEHQPPAPPTNSQTEASPDSTCPCPNMSTMCKHDTW